METTVVLGSRKFYSRWMGCVSTIKHQNPNENASDAVKFLP